MINKPRIQVYLENLITEKGRDLSDEIKGLNDKEYGAVFGLTYNDLINFINEVSPTDKKTVLNTCTIIDFKNGDVFHFLNYLAQGMVNAR